MGWDVVEIGLGHDLPVADPIATAKTIAERFGRNLYLTALGETLAYISGGSIPSINLIMSDDICRKIRRKLGENFAGDVSQFIKRWLDELRHGGRELDEPLFMINEEEMMINVYSENVDLDIYVYGRWHSFVHAFKVGDDKNEICNLDWLLNYRRQIYEQAKLFGCKEVIICSDQGPTERIYNASYLTSDALMQMVYSRSYIYDQDFLGEGDKGKAEWVKQGKIVYFSDYVTGKVTFEEEEFVDVVIDDFKDLY